MRICAHSATRSLVRPVHPKSVQSGFCAALPEQPCVQGCYQAGTGLGLLAVVKGNCNDIA